MENLLDAVAALVCLVSPEKVQAIASRVRRTESHKSATVLAGVIGTPVASEVVGQLVHAWRASGVSPNELASMLLAASHVFTKVAGEQSTELVWTGPTTPFVSARRTEQALLQIINAADRTLFITSFVMFKIPSILNRLSEAALRHVDISMLLESSEKHGGAVSVDGVAKMRESVPQSHLYVWREKDEPFRGGRVHAKVAVADATTCFITSANLTAFAMERNIEAGVLISGGAIPQLLDDHLRYLVKTNVVSEV